MDFRRDDVHCSGFWGEMDRFPISAPHPLFKIKHLLGRIFRKTSKFFVSRQLDPSLKMTDIHREHLIIIPLTSVFNKIFLMTIENKVL